MDTSGFVEGPPQGVRTKRIYWPDFDAFTQGYIEALFATQIMVPGPNGPEPLLHPAFSDLAAEALAQIIADCAARQADQPGLGDKAHDGARFWQDRQTGAACTAAGEPIPPLTPYLDADGKVRLQETTR